MTNVRITKYGNIDVVTAARNRIINIFESGLPVYVNFSGGKDSLCLGHVVLTLIQEGKINPSQVIGVFVDEEAIFDGVEEIVKDWRIKFMLAGCEFRWYCIEVKHYNCFNQLANDESFICWDRNKEKDWIRRPPEFAIRYHPMLKEGNETYQTFLSRITRDGVQAIGIRLSESVQRANYFAAAMKTSGGRSPVKASNALFPIYDWNNNDVWLYLKNNNITIPIEYVYLWQVGTAKHRLRISQFFSIDTAGSLVKLSEFANGLMEKIIRREPNAYLASLYWDSEMFRRSGTNRRKIEKDLEDIDYKALTFNLLSNIQKNFETEKRRKEADNLLRRINLIVHMMDNNDWKVAHAILVAGDPKGRMTRGLVTDVIFKYAGKTGVLRKENQKGGEGQ